MYTNMNIFICICNDIIVILGTLESANLCDKKSNQIRIEQDNTSFTLFYSDDFPSFVFVCVCLSVTFNKVLSNLIFIQYSKVPEAV